jgi:hypothetical protein
LIQHILRLTVPLIGLWAATNSNIHQANIPFETLARRWGTSINTAERTLKQTTQRGLQYLQASLDGRFGLNKNTLTTSIFIQICTVILCVRRKHKWWAPHALEKLN